jgi:predicted PolB exonuclease-like 3'-5' exonuclease
VCVSFVSGTIHTFKGGKEKYVVKNVKSEGRNGESEEEILRAVFSHLNRHSSRLISFNGRGFDMPVLQYRAMKYGIDAKWIYSDGYYNYNHRYSIEKHCDLLEMFSNFGASARVKMAEVCALFKVPCKSNGIDGSSVLGLFKEGKLSQIADYCENDVIATYILYLRFMQHSGKLSAEGYNICLDNLCAMLKADDANPSHALFVEQLMQMNGGNPHIALPQGAVKQEDGEEELDEGSQDEASHDESSHDESSHDESSHDENSQNEASQDEGQDEENQGR